MSVVVPVRDEAESVLPLAAEVHAALVHEAFELIFVDDGSRDGTAASLVQAQARYPRVRVLRHVRSCGQSAALRTGVRAARGALVVTLDGDGQNDPADVPALLAACRRWAGGPAGSRPLGLVAGQRVRRLDGIGKRLASRFANAVRARVLGDAVPDTGCGLKAFPRDTFLALPYFDHMHRFLPALVRREGCAVALVAVGHRPRLAGRSKYGLLDRAAAGVVDLLGVLWLARRCRLPRVEEA
ncbi:MAG TPA: glycosyltransferase family 2 protein [Methylomirabilota bacterium]|nr:glycosyltransferase family 2 protein [Methylomirabilota bacterium]